MKLTLLGDEREFFCVFLLIILPLELWIVGIRFRERMVCLGWKTGKG
jgi:hypothetical protein